MNARLRLVLLAVASVLTHAPADAAVTAAPGFAVRTIPTPATVGGGVVRAGDAILVGQGPSFSPNAQSVIRLEGGVATTIATGFSSLGGFALGRNGTLYVVDNAKELPGASTGDTVYAIPKALSRTDAVAAADVEVVPDGSIPSAFDVAVAPDGALLVSDAAGPGAGTVVRVASGGASPFATGFDYTGGLAIAGGTVFVANSDASFVGSVRRRDLTGAPLPALVGGLAGAYAIDVETDGRVLVTGVLADDFSSSIVAVAPDGSSVTERARGFAFTSEIFFDAARDEALVIDFGVSHVFAICRDGDGDGVCDADDGCPADADPGQEDTDGDGFGDVCDLCEDDGIGNVKATLQKIADDLANDRLKLRGEIAGDLATIAAAAAGGIRVVLAHGVDIDVPGGALWKIEGTTATYKDEDGAANGVRKIVLSAPKKRPGVVKIAISGKNGIYPVGPTGGPAGAAVVLSPPGGACGEVAFDDAACKTNPRKGSVTCR
jgi:hypothetical protein